MDEPRTSVRDARGNIAGLGAARAEVAEPLTDLRAEAVGALAADGHVSLAMRVDAALAARAEVAEPLSARGVIGRGMMVRADVAEPTGGHTWAEHVDCAVADCAVAYLARADVAEPGDLACDCANGDGTSHPKYHAASCPIRRAATAGREPLDALRDLPRVSVCGYDGDELCEDPNGDLVRWSDLVAALDTPDPERR